MILMLTSFSLPLLYSLWAIPCGRQHMFDTRTLGKWRAISLAPLAVPDAPDDVFKHIPCPRSSFGLHPAREFYALSAYESVVVSRA